jgi:soluble lytic murein transglycosylase
MLSMQSDQMQRTGSAMQGLGSELNAEAVEAAHLANQPIVADSEQKAQNAYNTMRFGVPVKDANGNVTQQGGYLQLQSKDALAPDPNTGLSLEQTYTGKLKDALGTIEAGLTNDDQRAMFRAQTANMLPSFQGQLQQHVFQQQDIYTKQSNQGAAEMAAETAGLNYNNPTIVSEQVKKAQQAAYYQTVHDGIPGDMQTNIIKTTGSAVHAKVIAAALENNNPMYAQAYYEANKGDMTANDSLAVLGKLNTQVNTQTAMGVVNATTQHFSTQIQPNDITRLQGVVQSLESAGNPNAVGKFISKQNTAKGSMQVMDATNANPGYGVKPAQDNSPAERARVGNDYIVALVQKYGGIDKGLAAYNAGPGALEAAIKADPNNWLAHMPKETQAYVNKGTAMYQSGGGAAPFPTELEFVNHAKSQLPATANPQLISLTQTQAEQQYAMLKQARKDQGEQALQQAQQALIANGGQLNALPPSVITNLAAVNPGAVDGLTAFAKAVNPVTRDQVVTDQKAFAMAVTYPNELAKMSDATFAGFLKTNFSPSDQEKISKLRAGVINGTTDTGIGSVNFTTMNKVLSNRLTAYGISQPKPNASDDDKQRWGSIQRFVTDDIIAAQRDIGHKLTPDEVTQHIDHLIMTNINFKNTFMGIGYGSVEQKPMMTMKPGDIPSGDVDAIRQSFAKHGINNPTNDQILRAYWKNHAK